MVGSVIAHPDLDDLVHDVLAGWREAHQGGERPGQLAAGKHERVYGMLASREQEPISILGQGCWYIEPCKPEWPVIERARHTAETSTVVGQGGACCTVARSPIMATTSRARVG